MGWNSYGLDKIAQELVLNAKLRDSDSLNQSYKMRMAVAYGLERFWGEHLRLQKKEPEKSVFWKETWDALEKVLKKAGITLPNDPVNVDDTKAVKAMSERLWNELNLEKQRVALAILTQLCDCIVWWTQRYKGRSKE
ncbi:hypothetical protein [Lyngbya sp. PCC 8106]|uniref:hypothetical protein n=1 Tax=Lyngbya sp. (strain PCC 8106) TaxID=313612 RepID=UPI0000EAB761|nr:hypothetical protein [Lyngbya sp. PCC 8106]EAW36545.1 hypothetical protein L8106_11987 [Lyngbya sp. PCC 8106]